ncbi:MAG: glycosyltransferase family 4 protein, partial [Bryobacteraceae bacterium]
YQPEKVFVVYPASRFEEPRDVPRPSRFDMLEPERFWLNVGTIEPRKNQCRLLEAYARLVAWGHDSMPLVLAGAKGWLMEEFDRTLDGLRLGDRVILTGYVNEDELRWLYQNCFAFVYPSLFEGFGMPVLEAMSLGAPVICSNAGSLPEVAGDAALCVDPSSPAGFASAMLQLAAGEVSRDKLVALGLHRACTFSWRTSAQRLVEIYDEVVSITHQAP